MPTLATILAFAVPAIVCVTMPGPAVLYISARGIRQGRRAGIVAVLGVDAGTLVHILLIALGLGAVIASSDLAFAAIRFGGAAYLVWLGLSKLASRSVPPCVIPGAPPTRLRTIWARGMAINLLNPGLVLFLLALLPQFVDPDRGSVAAWLGRHPRANLYCGRFSGAMYLTFGTLAGASAVAA